MTSKQILYILFFFWSVDKSGFNSQVLSSRCFNFLTSDENGSHHPNESDLETSVV
jgi:hypothetical protein